VGVVQIDDPDHPGGARLESFTCGHRIAGLSANQPVRPKPFRGLSIATELAPRVRRQLASGRAEFGRRAKGVIEKLRG
jgi:hypothetical protein